ncbi:MAG: hypothetical protein JWN51_568, partial [Phycisphaerales bacterium]|nr:hypothetical protein [Phycisphaerales bacterium]
MALALLHLIGGVTFLSTLFECNADSLVQYFGRGFIILIALFVATAFGHILLNLMRQYSGPFSWILIASLAVVLQSAPSRAADVPQDDIAILPRDFTLAGPVARQTLLVEKLHEGRAIGEAEDVSFTSSDPNVLKIHGKTAVPMGNGKATLTATSGDRTASAPVTVTAFDKPAVPSFRNDIQPILMAGGCSSGACHGAAAGKNGFKLSLRGYDDEGDWRALTRHAMGRRLDTSEPGRSLMLLKPTAAVPHKGGERIKPGSIEYNLLAEWIASGAPGPRADDPR